MKFAKAGELQLYVRSMGKLFRVVAIFDTDGAANDYMAKHTTCAVVAVQGDVVFLAEKYQTLDVVVSSAVNVIGGRPR